MTDEGVRARVHFEMEPWHIDRSGAELTGFAIGPPEARAPTLTGLNSKFKRALLAYGQPVAYFVNRVTAVRIAEVAPTPAATLLGGTVQAAPVAGAPHVGEATAEYLVRDINTGLDLGAFAEFADAMAHARGRASVMRPLVIDLVITERIGLLERSGASDWADQLLSASRAPAMIAAEAKRRIDAAISAQSGPRRDLSL